MPCPKAKPVCAHAEVRFCTDCKVVHCMGCDESWGGAKRGASADEFRAFWDLLHERQRYAPTPKTPDWAIPMRRGSVQGVLGQPAGMRQTSTYVCRGYPEGTSWSPSFELLT